MKPRVKVSVLMLTYNHEKYIADAIESVVKQQADFPFELVIGEDRSTDNTARICREYQEKYPDLIKLTINEENLGLQENFIRTYNQCSGEYMAICEGDDFWISKHKLQIQADFLDQHKEYSACFHRALNYYQEDGSKSIGNGGYQKKVNTVFDIINSNPITNVTVMFRLGLFGELPSWFSKVTSYDFAIHVLNAEHGDVYFMNKVMAVYRQHKESIWSMATSEKQILISVINRQLLIDHYKDKNKSICDKLTETYTNGCVRLAQYYHSIGNTEKELEAENFILKANPALTIEQVKEMEKVKKVPLKKKISQRIFRLIKAIRREVSKLIPLPKI
ncbi:glycosyltransferase [uncultured Bacteroides sp.]|uniref:glycosyltransferase n=1 Tax=uncultured Bacteroides sp. TaxID=162156 RepID=UPI002AAB0F6D|nr:glycosyltransferase [uncultured Bacteroides sp.]